MTIIKQIVTLKCRPYLRNQMKKMMLFVFMTGFLLRLSAGKSQDLPFRETIEYINSLLKANPYVDTFLEIIFYYSIDISTDKELVVKMEFDGPFKTILKSKIRDLNLSPQKDSTYDNPGSICWNCMTNDLTNKKKCVINETIPTDGESEFHSSDNICVMFSKQNEVRYKLIRAFDKLFKEVLQSGSKE